MPRLIRAIVPSLLRLAPVAVICALALPARLGAQDGKPPVALRTAPLAGQNVPILPLTLIAADSSVEADSGYTGFRERRAALARADSIINDEIAGRAPEVVWVLPQQLRTQARRSPGLVNDPDQLGQAVLRSPKMTKVPDPLRSSLRNLAAIGNARYVLVPAALGFTHDAAGGFRADLTLTLVDTRRGEVIWRSLASASSGSPGDALRKAVRAVLPVEGIGS